MALDFYMIEAMPQVLIGDRAADSDDLNDHLLSKGSKLEPISKSFEH